MSARPPDIRREIVVSNRLTWSAVPSWIDRGTWEKSRFHYGMPEAALQYIDAPIDDQATVTDLLCALAEELGPRARYLELGVSVGKTFYQLARRGIPCTGLDIERPAPVLDALLHAFAKGASPSSPCQSVHYFGDRITYVEGDVHDPDAWALLRGPFSLVFSDACHDPNSLRWEMEALRRLSLLDREGFTILFDDLEGNAEGPMCEAVAAGHDALIADGWAVTLDAVRINGWIGQHEHQHLVGILRGSRP